MFKPSSTVQHVHSRVIVGWCSLGAKQERLLNAWKGARGSTPRMIFNSLGSWILIWSRCGSFQVATNQAPTHWIKSQTQGYTLSSLQKVLPKRSDPDRKNVLDVLNNDQTPHCHVTLHRWHHSKKLSHIPHIDLHNSASSKWRGRHSLGSRSMLANTSEHSALLQSSRPNIFPAPQIPLAIKPHSNVHNRLFQVVSEKMQNWPKTKCYCFTRSSKILDRGNPLSGLLSHPSLPAWA